MGSVECATKRIGYPDQGLIQKYIRCLSYIGFKFMEYHFPSCFFLSFFPSHPSAHTHTHTHVLYSLFLEGAEGESENT